MQRPQTPQRSSTNQLSRIKCHPQPELNPPTLASHVPKPQSKHPTQVNIPPTQSQTQNNQSTQPTTSIKTTLQPLNYFKQTITTHNATTQAQYNN